MTRLVTRQEGQKKILTGEDNAHDKTRSKTRIGQDKTRQDKHHRNKTRPRLADECTNTSDRTQNTGLKSWREKPQIDSWTDRQHNTQHIRQDHLTRQSHDTRLADINQTIFMFSSLSTDILRCRRHGPSQYLKESEAKREGSSSLNAVSNAYPYPHPYPYLYP